MANEAIMKIETGLSIPFNCLDGTGIEKGCLLKLSGGLSCIAHSALGDMFAGIAATEKIVSNGTTSVGVYREGIALCYVSGALVAGQVLQLGPQANHMVLADTAANVSGARTCGIILEDNAGALAQKYVEIRPGVTYG